MKYITALILLLAMTTAQAEEITIPLELPTVTEDGKPIDTSEIWAIKVHIRTGESGLVWQVPVSITSIKIESEDKELSYRFSTVFMDNDRKDGPLSRWYWVKDICKESDK